MEITDDRRFCSTIHLKNLNFHLGKKNEIIYLNQS
jgi:hypothetical protein